MTTEEALYQSIGQALPDAEPGQLFGKPCFKTHGKAFTCFFQNEMVFKLPTDHHREALSLDGSHLFDPSGKNRPMKEWVQVPATHQAQWPAYAKAAQQYVSGK
jgi:hypothetical protein